MTTETCDECNNALTDKYRTKNSTLCEACFSSLTIHQAGVHMDMLCNADGAFIKAPEEDWVNLEEMA